jgi:hypothetical protein
MHSELTSTQKPYDPRGDRADGAPQSHPFGEGPFGDTFGVVYIKFANVARPACGSVTRRCAPCPKRAPATYGPRPSAVIGALEGGGPASEQPAATASARSADVVRNVWVVILSSLKNVSE